MKKTLTLILALAMTISLAACGKQADAEDKADSNAPADALTILTTAWDSFGDDEKFPATGGDYDNPVEDAPGVFDHSNADNLNYLLSVPAEEAEKIDDAASLMHMMNANNFTCGAFHTASAEDAAALAQAMRDAIAGKQWMCGFPDKLVVLTLDQYVVSMYGLEDNINNFRDKLTAAYPDAVVVFDEAVL